MKVAHTFRVSRFALIAACAAAWLSLTPSLLPRSAAIQGALAGVAAILGYGCAVLLIWLLRSAGVPSAPRWGRATSTIVFSALGILSLIMLTFGQIWQQEQRRMLSMPAAANTDPLVVVSVAIALFFLLLFASRGVAAVARKLGRLIARVLPARAATVLGGVLTLTLALTLVNVVGVTGIAARLDGSFAAINSEFTTDLAAPKTPEVSAGPGSAVSWESLGRQGRVFIANTPSRQNINDFYRSLGAESAPDTVPQPAAKQPIRVYIGSEPQPITSDVEVTEILKQQADSAIAELERTGAFQRSVINIATGTGRGWVNENQARALEYLWHGDTATVSMQYSYLPSWMSYLVDGQRAREAGRILFDAVYLRLQAIPKPQRPQLVVSGESLGSFGSEGAFTGVSDLVNKVDGALWVGPTANNQLWGAVTELRDPSTPVFAPIFQRGSQIRFSDDGVHWPGVTSWRTPRIGYVQHANDPVTWFSAASFVKKPALYDAQAAPYLPQQLVWVPVLSGLQLIADQIASDVPAGQGHEFGEQPVYAWAQILPPSDVDDRAVAQLAQWLSQLRASDPA